MGLNFSCKRILLNSLIYVSHNLFVFGLQESVHRRLSMRFRNIRRYSEHMQAITSSSKASLESPNDYTTENLGMHTEEEDEVAYTRNMERLLLEFKKPRVQIELMEKLLKLTFERRRKIIDESLLHVVDLLDEFPIFKVKTWVRKYIATIMHTYSYSSARI